MNRHESKYFATAEKMDEAFLELLNKKEFEFITVKEICTTAGVNRSTFYLHYETINDILVETGEYITKKFASYFDGKTGETLNIGETELDNLLFINSEYLTPWLTFIKDNKRLFQTFIKRYDTLGMAMNHSRLFSNIFQPILKRFQVKEEDHKYLYAFYIEGVIAIVKVWIEENCERPIEEIIERIEGCIKTYEHK